mmetsp:Transcript_25780/g.54503  ORF Transcript_25780/g.54503 Transcript_25780/m.54503 type:complete len:274 (+) Transcript_25780:107-928(+)
MPLQKRPKFTVSSGRSRAPSLRLKILCGVAISLCTILHLLLLVYASLFTQQTSPLPWLSCHSIQKGSFVTQILLGKRPFPEKCINNVTGSFGEGEGEGEGERGLLKYRPGTLQLSSVESLRHCYVNFTRYKKHINPRRGLYTVVSDRYKLNYIFNPKSASTTSRYYMKTFFDGTQLTLDYKELIENYTMFSFIREPLDRFYSSYDEAYMRHAPWEETNNETNESYDKPPFTILYEGIRGESYSSCRGSILDRVQFLDSVILILHVEIPNYAKY